MTSRRQALERNAAMAVAGEITSGRVALDGDGCLPLEALVAAHARRTASTRRVIAILQGWQWVRRVGPGRWTVGDGGADPHRAARADFPPDGKCAACTQDLTGAYTVAGRGRLVLCASCAEPVRSGVPLDDLVVVVAALLGARSADKASRLAHRLRARFPELAWEEIRRRGVEERIRIGGEREEARRGPRFAGTSRSAVEPAPDGEVPALPRLRAHPGERAVQREGSCPARLQGVRADPAPTSTRTPEGTPGHGAALSVGVWWAGHRPRSRAGQARRTSRGMSRAWTRRLPTGSRRRMLAARSTARGRGGDRR